jgi:hypothetical protein
MKMTVVCGLALSVALALPGWPQTPVASGVPLATQDRVRNPGWWPTKGVPSKNEYAGAAACRECHAARAATQEVTPMARAAAPTPKAEILGRHNMLAFVSGPYEFAISETAEGASYSVTDEAQTISLPLEWTFGTGEVGQTYVYEREGKFYESSVSYYPALQALDLTLGHHAPVAGDLVGALGRLMPPAEVRLCFGCHTTRSSSSGQFDVSSLIPGVSCEACHGPGERHVRAMRQKQIATGLKAILNPAHLSPVDAVDFCGACHRTTWDVALANTAGVADVRFQPYRLEKSRCWGKGDARLTCMACHDPHLPLERDPAAYDGRCLSCHASNTETAARTTVNGGSAHRASACPVGSSKCVTCHMAKYEIPGSHAKFTDHWIRVVKAGEAFPD